MRVIAGSAKGARLTAPSGFEVRPTLDRVREALFSILTPRLEEANFLDLFAGTGANGIEALSRGAEFSTFADNDLRSLKAIRQNLKATRLGTRASVCRLDLPSGLDTLSKRGMRYDIVFADPPYDYAREKPDAYLVLLDCLVAAQILGDAPIIVIEHDSRTALCDKAASLICTRHARYGETTLSFFT